MPRQLHILTRTDDPLAESIIEHQRQEPADQQVVVIDLTIPAPEYERLLDEIFAAESVAVW